MEEQLREMGHPDLAVPEEPLEGVEEPLHELRELHEEEVHEQLPDQLHDKLHVKFWTPF